MNSDKSSKTPVLRPELTLELMQERCKGYLPELIGLEMVHISIGKLSSRLAVRPDLLAPNGFLNAATVIGLADTTCGWGTLAHLPEGAENFTTIELKTNFLGTLREGSIFCEGQLEHSGRTLQVWGAEVRIETTGRILALFRCTQLILWPGK